VTAPLACFRRALGRALLERLHLGRRVRALWPLSIWSRRLRLAAIGPSLPSGRRRLWPHRRPLRHPPVRVRVCSPPGLIQVDASRGKTRVSAGSQASVTGSPGAYRRAASRFGAFNRLGEVRLGLGLAGKVDVALGVLRVLGALQDPSELRLEGRLVPLDGEGGALVRHRLEPPVPAAAEHELLVHEHLGLRGRPCPRTCGWRGARDRAT
jgi:hypothetical protein